jgi:hypothetical protein
MVKWLVIVVAVGFARSAHATVDPDTSAYLQESFSEEEKAILYEWALLEDPPLDTVVENPTHTVTESVPVGRKRKHPPTESNLIDLDIADAMSVNLTVSPLELLERLTIHFPSHNETLDSIRRRKNDIVKMFCVPEWLHLELLKTSEQLFPPSDKLLNHIASLVPANEIPHLRNPSGLLTAVSIWCKLVIPAARAWTKESPTPFSVTRGTFNGKPRNWLLLPRELAQRVLQSHVKASRKKFGL